MRANKYDAHNDRLIETYSSGQKGSPLGETGMSDQDRENHVEKQTALAQQINNSTLLTPHISGHTLISEEARTSLHVFYAGDLMENGYWKHIEHRPLYHTYHL
jgi:hypothetical protein